MQFQTDYDADAFGAFGCPHLFSDEWAALIAYDRTLAHKPMDPPWMLLLMSAPHLEVIGLPPAFE